MSAAAGRGPGSLAESRIDRAIREQAEARDLYLAGHPDKRGLELAMEDWVMEEVMARADGDGSKETYRQFLDRKHRRVPQQGFEPGPINPMLFPFQAEIVRRACRVGRYAIFSECGTGKTPMQLEWGRQVLNRSAMDPADMVIIFTPLAVAHQTIEEGRKFGVEVTLARAQAQCRPGINVANYEMLHHFDAAKFVGVVLDESSILKSYTGTTKRKLLSMFGATPYRLACTATPAPNDHMELGNHLEFLGIMRSSEMLARWFINDTMKAGGYRLKRYAEADFWQFLSTCSTCIDKPSDMDYDDGDFLMPPLKFIMHEIAVDITIGAGEGQLFRVPDMSSTGLHREMRLTAAMRAAAVAEMVNSSNEHWIVWCNTDYESIELMARIEGAIEVKGSHSPHVKESRLIAFSDGHHKVIVTKPSIAGFGLNWQHVHLQAFVGLSYSYEQLYQAVRRSWRYGQRQTVYAHIFMAETEGPVFTTLRRKQADHERMKAEMIQSARQASVYSAVSLSRPTHQIEVPVWLQTR